MHKKLFGTDGIRGIANQGNMTADMALKIGMAAGSLFTKGDYRHRVVIGKDTRLSGYLIEEALTAGFISVGLDVIMVGPMPTPAIAMLTRSIRADLGVMISASHNPYQDNGIKLFGPDGFKLSNNVEKSIERRIIDPNLNNFLVAPAMLGKAKRLDDAPGRYIEFVKNSFPKGKTLEGLRIVLDTANGAAYHLGKDILWELGAEVITIGDKPDGFNINANCGSVFPESLISTVISQQADIGIALDGDADRLIIVDELGNVVDGDQILALITKYHQSISLLSNDIVVATVMSNLALEEYLNKINIRLVRTKIGDRYVAEKMRQLGASVGGEQSGHLILSNYNTTGDGLIGALQVLAALIDYNQTASSLTKLFTPLPQVIRNIPYTDLAILERVDVIKEIEASQQLLVNKGRMIIRKSGTEPIIRVMIESKDTELINQLLSNIESQLKDD